MSPPHQSTEETTPTQSSASTGFGQKFSSLWRSIFSSSGDSRPASGVVPLSLKWDIGRSYEASDHDPENWPDERREAHTAMLESVDSGLLTYTPFASAVKSQDLSQDDRYKLTQRGWSTSGSAMWKAHCVPTCIEGSYDNKFKPGSLERDVRDRHAASILHKLTTRATPNIAPCSESTSGLDFAISLQDTFDQAASQVSSVKRYFLGLQREGEIAPTQTGYYRTRKEKENNPPRTEGDWYVRGKPLRYGFQRIVDR